MDILKILNGGFKQITEVYSVLTAGSLNEERLPTAAEWLLDNYYIIERQVKQMQSANRKELRLLERRGAEPLIWIWARELLNKSKLCLSEEQVIDFLADKQSSQPLNGAGLRLFTVAVRGALIWEISKFSAAIRHTIREYKKAGELLKKPAPDFTAASDSAIEHAYYLARGDSALLEKLDGAIAAAGKNHTQILSRERAAQAEMRAATGNAITSLTAVLDIDWPELFESLSPVDNLLSRDGFYKMMDSESKAYYRGAVEEIARKCKKSEIDVAAAALKCAANKKGRRAHVGYYIVDDGRAELFSALGRKKLAKLKPLPLYLVVSKILAGLILWGIKRASGSIIPVFAAALPAFDVALTLVNYLVGKTLKPRALPKLALKEGIPKAGKTIICVPSLIPSPSRAAELVEKLEVCYLANRQDNIYFAILGDFKDTTKEKEEADNAIIEESTKAINALNEKYNDRFFYFHRNREYNGVQRKWMGWERKRGALCELNKFLRGGARFSHTVGNLGLIDNVKYVITLDSDTFLPIDAAKKLIGTMMHPLHIPVIEGGVVKEGYGVVQPRVSVDLESANKSLFSRVFAGQGGIDPYTTAVSDLYQDMFGEAIFTGKGIYDVDAFIKCLEDTIPENAVLSHDLLEGCYTRCALAGDIEVYDGYPHRYDAFIARMHRWIRGDWQLLPWLGAGVKNRAGERVKNPLSALSKWKIIDNMRRSLVSPFLLALLLLGFGILPGHTVLWVGFVLFCTCFPLILYAIDSFGQKNFYFIGQKRNATIIYGFRGWAYQTIMSISFLAYQGLISLDAALRSVTRVALTKRNTLEWVTAADSESAAKNTLSGYFAKMSPSVAMAAATVTTALACAVSDVGLSIIFAAIWCAAPALAYFISIPAVADRYRLKPRDEENLRRIAHSTWQYFNDFTSKHDNFLPPDNFQEEPLKGVAHRTSPTNIGLGLLSILSARDFGFINTGEMAEQIENTVATVEKLDKWKGHLYNWYDTQTLEPLKPRYASTVDSGNFVGYLMVVAAGAAEYGSKETGELREKLASLSRRMLKIADETAFAPLYDEKKQLFSIGFNIEENRLTSSYYDLLASEARQTSFLAIARGEVGVKHWFKLGRSLTASDGYRGLVSWSGTMFEYLMPLLIIRNYQNSLMDETYWFAVRAQKKYGRKRRVPWGTSESGFYGFDVNLNYQYRAFGVPELGLKRGLISDMVVAPYATLLALMTDTKAALINLARLRKDGMEGRYGFYEAADYTPARLARNEKRSIVKSYMAHHQGMGLCAIANLFFDNIMQKRFHSYPYVKAAELLLKERVPVRAILTKDQKEKVQPFKTPKWQATDECVRIYEGSGGVLPEVHALSNGSYSVIIDERGNGYSSLNGIYLNRFRPDPLEFGRGQMIFIKNTFNRVMWNVYGDKAVFAPHKAEFAREDGGIDTRVEIAVSPEDSVEIRRVTLINRTAGDRVMEITTYSEIALSDPRQDLAHPVFSNLFVRTSFEDGALIAARRPRSEDDKAVFGLHMAVAEGSQEGETEFETDRARFIGRGRDLLGAAAFEGNSPLGGTKGAVLDPIFSLRLRINVKAGEAASVDLISAIAGSEEEISKIKEKYSRPGVATDVFDAAYARGRAEGKYLGLNENEEESFLTALKHIIYGGYASERQAGAIAQNHSSREGLWKIGLSGDMPIIIIKISQPMDLEALKELLRAHEFYRARSVVVDIVILCDEPAGYIQPLSDMAREVISTSHARDMQGRAGGVFLFKAGELPPEDITLLYAFSALDLDASKGRLMEQFPKTPELCANRVNPAPQEEDMPLPALEFFNGFGGFDLSRGEYVIKQSKMGQTPAPWVNIIANPSFGFIAGESGGGYTYAGSSSENRLTEWSNDPVSDKNSEALYIKSDDNVWSVTAAPISESGSFLTCHGLGYTRYLRNSRGIDSELTLFAPEEGTVKIGLIRLKNTGERQRGLNLIYEATPVMGTSVYKNRGSHCSYLIGEKILAIKNGRGGRGVMFLSGSEPLYGYTAERANFSPAAPLSGKIGAGFDHLAAVSFQIDLMPGEEKTAAILLGWAEDDEGAQSLCKKFKTVENSQKAFEGAVGYWRSLTGAIKVETPSPAGNTLLNSWLLYQATACRLYARTAFYQSGGAWGFRDQLQDVMALVYTAPHLTRAQILLHCRHQFEEGDVMHWWHPSPDGPTARGVRSRFVDDRLWLPYVAADYIEITGDEGILDEAVPFLSAPPLKDYETERYFEAGPGKGEFSVYEHCIRAIDASLQTGEHDLPLIHGGDWNDGMNAVGIGGKGESIWLAWFIKTVLESFAPICKKRGDADRAAHYEMQGARLAEAAELNAWDGSWYLRAFFDDKTPIGSNQNTECRIDAISQAWAVLSGGGRKSRVKTAMESVENHLVDKERGIIKLLAPPFDKIEQNPGYIKSYVPGVRENGGQYTHAAIWVAAAFARMGEGDKAAELFEMINPINHSRTNLEAAVYKLEPYVMAADIYTVKGHEGRGGWSWYTGAAAWMYRLGLEYILGFKKRGESIEISPEIPRGWGEFSIEYKYLDTPYLIKVKNTGTKSKNKFTLVNDGKKHVIDITI